MPWTVDDPPPPARNWTESERRRCVEAANAVLAENGDEEQAIYACIRAAGKTDKQGARPMERKTFHAFTTKVDEPQGIVEQIVAVYGHVDLGKDRIWPGAFAKSIAERGLKVRVLDQHQTDSIMRVIGKPLAIRELSRAELPDDLLVKYPDATGALWTRTQYLMDTPEGKGAFARIASGAVDESSIGYDALDIDYTNETYEGKPATIRNLRTCRLWEYSNVIWGMQPATQTLNVKADNGGNEMEPKARDFQTILSQRQVQEALNDLHWEMRRSLDEAIQSCLEDQAMDASGKLALIAQSLDQYKVAMLGWCERVMAMVSQPDNSRSVAEIMSGNDPSEIKAGRVLSSTNAGKIRAALASLTEVLKAAGLIEEPEDEDEGKGDKALPIDDSHETAKAGPDKPPTSNAIDVARLVDIELMEFETLEV